MYLKDTDMALDAQEWDLQRPASNTEDNVYLQEKVWRGVSLRELKLALSQLNWHARDLFHFLTIHNYKHIPEVWQLILHQKY